MHRNQDPFSQAPNALPKTGLLFPLALLLGLTLILAVGCFPEPTPTPAPRPFATRRNTSTPFPTLTPRPAATPTGIPIRAVVTDTLRVRESPSTEARILGRLRKDDTVLLLSRTDDNQWFSIEYPPTSGQIGWIFGEVVVPQGDTRVLPIGSVVPKPPEGAAYATVRTEGDPLRMRAGPGTSYEVLARIPDLTRLLVVARSPDQVWFQVVFPAGSGQRGWVSGDFLRFEGPTDSMQIVQPPPTPTPGPTAVPRPTRAPNVPTGGTILVSSNRDGAYNLFALGENGAVRRELTRSGNAFGARLSPGGERIVFYRTAAASPNLVNHVFVMDFDGRNVLDLSAGAGGSYSDSDPDWSPDGRQLVFVRTPRAGAPELWTMNADGSNARRLLRLSAATGVTREYSPQPRWSPDGGRIAYAAVPRARVPGVPLYPAIFTVNSRGGDERQLTDNDMINASPVWSPDGSQLAWAAKDFINRQNWRVWLMNASGADQRPWFNAPGNDPNSGAQPVAWRANQVLIAGWTGNWDAYLASAAGGELARVTSGLNDELPTDWLP